MNLDYTAHYKLVMEALGSRGLLLGSCDQAGRANLMTIGWGTLGAIWGMPIWTVLVRPSRYTYRCIEARGTFSVCVPTPQMAGACTVCGTKSGRDIDKPAACKLTTTADPQLMAPDVAQCPIVYQCQVVHSNDLLPPRLAPEVQAGFYKSGDYHRVYFGKVLAVRVDPDAAARLA